MSHLRQATWMNNFYSFRDRKKYFRLKLFGSEGPIAWWTELFLRCRCLGDLEVNLIFLNGTMYFLTPAIVALLESFSLATVIQGRGHTKGWKMKIHVEGFATEYSGGPSYGNSVLSVWAKFVCVYVHSVVRIVVWVVGECSLHRTT